MLFVYFLLILVGFFITIKGADYLIDGASSLAKRFGVSELIIGLTIVALGTSAPEMVVNIYSSINGKDALILGNIIGSNLFNTLVILGIAALIYPIAIKKSTAFIEIPFSIFAGLILLFFVNDSFFNSSSVNVLSRWEGVILLGLFLLFMGYIVYQTLNDKIEDNTEYELLSRLKTAVYMIGGISGLTIGGKIVVDNAIKVAKSMGISDSVIGLTILAAGTSLPELVTAIAAARKKKSDLAIGNIIGSNIFNILLVLAISSTISPIKYNTALNLDMYVLLSGGAILFISLFTFGKRKLDKVEAILLLLLYSGYLGYMLMTRL